MTPPPPDAGGGVKTASAARTVMEAEVALPWGWPARFVVTVTLLLELAASFVTVI
jgi:hypothetical protein